ncbi:SIS domain-containing protein [bacterium]|nr:SIS domain-containing protein [bacterium]
MHTNATFPAIVPEEIHHVISAISPAQVEALMQAITDADGVFVCGAGRSLLMMQAFAMRLVHLGMQAYVVGETITPAIGPGHLLIAGTGSGQTRITLAMLEAAQAREAKIAALTAHPQSPIGLAADLVVEIPTPVTVARGVVRASVQPPGSLFEQCLLVLCDTMVMMFMQRLGVTEEQMRDRHTKLE